MSWETVTLEELAVKRGGSVDPSKHPDETFELFSIPAYDSGIPDICPGREIGSSKKCVEPNDVLLSRIVPHIRRSWIVTPANSHRQIASGEWIQFRSDAFHPRYLRHFLVSDPFHSQFMQTVSGVGGSLLRARPAQVFQIKNPLPPLSEQKRIAGILDAADALRTKRREAIEQLDLFLEAVFIDLFGDLRWNTKNWEESGTLGDFADVASGITKGRKLNGGPTREVPYLAVINVQDRHLWLDTVKTIEASEAEIDRYRLVPGDLVLTEGGDRDKLGRGSLWSGELEDCIHQNHIFRVRVVDERLHSVFVEWLVGSSRGKAYFLRSAKQTTGIASINMRQLRAFPMVLPPLALQQQFARIVEAVEQQKARMRSHLAALDALFASLQQRAFAGEL